VAAFLVLALVLALPFFFSGLAIAFTFSRAVTQASRVYLADLVGAGSGAILAVVGISLTSAEVAIGLTAALGAGAALAFAWAHGPRVRAGLSVCVVAAPIAALGLSTTLDVPSFPPRELGLFVERYPDLRHEYQRWGPIARIDVVSLPGDRIELPQPIEYKFVAQDGSAPSIILSLNDVRTVDFADHTILGIPYWIKSQPEVLIIGLGGGPDVQAALHYNARRIVGVEINMGMIDIVKDAFADFAGRPYDDPRVEIVLGDGRNVIQSIDDQFDIVQLTGVDTAVATFGASPNLAESYLYTVEAIQAYWSRLKPDGVLSISFPNVEGLGPRLFALIVTALGRAGLADIDRHIVLSHTGGFIHILAKRVPFTAQELEKLQDRFDQPMRGIYYPLFDRLLDLIEPELYTEDRIVFAPGLDEPSAYREFYTAWQAGQDAEWLAAQSFDLSAPSDDRPFFFIRDRWFRMMPNLSLLLLLLTALLFFALFFILLPLAIFRRRSMTSASSGRLVTYFTCLGLAYLFIEVFLIQKMTLFLGHPAFSIPTVLGALLIASGLGSGWSGRLVWPARLKVLSAVIGIAGLVALHLVLVQPVLLDALDQPLAVRIAIAIAVIVPIGFVMGVPFPSVLRTLDRHAPGFVAWAWGINATASVLASVLALLLAVTWGYVALVAIAAGLYIMAALVVPSALRAASA
jgi:spermidine synthase